MRDKETELLNSETKQYIYDKKQAEVVSTEPANKNLIIKKEDILKKIVFYAIISLEIPGFFVSCTSLKEEHNKQDQAIEKSIDDNEFSVFFSAQEMYNEIVEDLVLENSSKRNR